MWPALIFVLATALLVLTPGLAPASVLAATIATAPLGYEAVALPGAGAIPFYDDPINNPPVGADTTIVIDEDADYPFTTADFPFSDPKNAPPNALLQVHILNAPKAGTVLQNGTPVVKFPLIIMLADFGAGRVTFRPAPDVFGPGYAALTFAVEDDGGTANGGQPLEKGFHTLTIDVRPVADTPSVTNAATDEDTQTTSGLVIARNPKDGKEVRLFRITSIQNGTLFLGDGKTPIDNDTFIGADDGDKGLRFTPTPDFSGSGSFGIQSATADDPKGLGGSVVTATIDVLPVNDPPKEIGLAGATVAENSPNGTIVGSFSVTDVDAGDTFTLALTDSAGGRFEIIGDRLLVADGSLLDFEASRSHQIVVQATDSGKQSIERRFTVAVTDVAEPPTAADDTYATPAQTALNVPAPGVLGNDTDPARWPLTSLLVAGTSHGTLQLNPDGSLAYTPAAGFAGIDAFTYRATAGGEQSVPATVTIQVTPALSVGDLEVIEPETGTGTAQLTITLSPASNQTVTVAVATSGGTATSGQDFQPVSTTLTFAPGQTARTFDVPVLADALNEPNETFHVTLSRPDHATLARAQATVLIANANGLGTLCASDPIVQPRVRQTASGQLEVTIVAPSGGLLQIEISPDGNTWLDLPANETGTYPNGATGLTDAVSLRPLNGARDFVFTVRRRAAGAFMARLVIGAGCGEWRTFVGGGTGVR
jgi:VCBS repeat-containing protein